MSSEAQADLAELQQTLLNTDSVEQFLHELAMLAARTVDDSMSCGIAVRQHVHDTGTETRWPRFCPAGGVARRAFLLRPADGHQR